MICRPCANRQHEKCDDLAREFRFDVWRAKLPDPDPTDLGSLVDHLNNRRRLIEANRPSRGCPCHHGEM